MKANSESHKDVAISNNYNDHEEHNNNKITSIQTYLSIITDIGHINIKYTWT